MFGGSKWPLGGVAVWQTTPIDRQPKAWAVSCVYPPSAASSSHSAVALCPVALGRLPLLGA